MPQNQGELLQHELRVSAEVMIRIPAQAPKHLQIGQVCFAVHADRDEHVMNSILDLFRDEAALARFPSKSRIPSHEWSAIDGSEDGGAGGRREGPAWSQTRFRICPNRGPSPEAVRCHTGGDNSNPNPEQTSGVPAGEPGKTRGTAVDAPWSSNMRGTPTAASFIVSSCLC
jgi:hypothetical protein